MCKKLVLPINHSRNHVKSSAVTVNTSVLYTLVLPVAQKAKDLGILKLNRWGYPFIVAYPA